MAGILRAGPSKLWTPSNQVRPNGIPRINWAHPLAFRLVSYWWPFGESGYIDLVTGDTTKKGTGAKNTQPVGRSSPYGSGPAFVAGTNFCESTNFGQFQSWTFPYSFACGWYQLGAETFSLSPSWFGLVDASGNDAWLIYSAANGTFGNSFGNSATAFNFSLVANTFYVSVGAATGTTAGSNWVNGLAQTANTTVVAFSGSSMRYTFGDINADATNTVDIINAITFFGAAWNGRALTASEAAQLYTDPYCFLIASEGEMPALFVAAGAPQLEELNWTIFRPRVSKWGH